MTSEVSVQKSGIVGTAKTLCRILKLPALVENLSFKDKTKTARGTSGEFILYSTEISKEVLDKSTKSLSLCNIRKVLPFIKTDKNKKTRGAASVSDNIAR